MEAKARQVQRYMFTLRYDVSARARAHTRTTLSLHLGQAWATYGTHRSSPAAVADAATVAASACAGVPVLSWTPAEQSGDKEEPSFPVLVTAAEPASAAPRELGSDRTVTLAAGAKSPCPGRHWK